MTQSPLFLLSSVLIALLFGTASRTTAQAASASAAIPSRSFYRTASSTTEPARRLQFNFGSVFENGGALCWLPFVGNGCDEENEDIMMGTCPDVSPLGADNFDLNEYIRQSWFVQGQQVNPYQQEEDLFCVVATYNLRDQDDLIQVQNTGRTGSVTGDLQGSVAGGEAAEEGFFSALCAEQLEGGSLQVAPCLFAVLGEAVFDGVAGPYWVLAVADDYEWAIVSGGPPDQFRETTEDGTTLCTTKEGSSFLDTNGSGLWLFSRTPQASEETMKVMTDKLMEMRIYAGDLKPVVQEGCKYPDNTKLN